MDKERHEFHMSIGAATIFMIFVILVMSIISILSYLRAKSYDESIHRQLSITSQYYQSEAKLMECYYQLDADDLEKQLKQMKREYQYQNGYYILEENLNNERVLRLTFEVHQQTLEIVSLKTESKEKSYGS
ncbi:hypothetical protein [Candidatus Stoquefichus massiliensis]|uniref:hypothetical protein n=1 Tax=Candidatus Stoquefichus massiliensis TaxID=1470350 RepID=UPI000480FEEB|nr:hypothetical protein [Candidatus Stoquefichus massiliensis]